MERNIKLLIAYDVCQRRRGLKRAPGGYWPPWLDPGTVSSKTVLVVQNLSPEGVRMQGAIRIENHLLLA